MSLAAPLKRMLICGLVFHCLVLCRWDNIRASDLLWEYAPYRVRVQLELSESASLLLGIPSNRAEEVIDLIRDQLPELTTLWFGALWELTVDPEPYQLPMPEKEGTPEFDKIMTIQLDTVGNELSVTGYDYDVRTHHLNTGETQVLPHPSELVTGVVYAMKSCFAPIALIEKSQGSEAYLKLRGGAIPSKGGEGQWKPGTLFIPFERRYNRNGELETVQPLSWTALVVQSQEGANILTKIDSSIPYSLKTRGGRGRTELFAIAPRFSRQPSQLVFVPRYLSFDENRIPNRLGFLPLLQIYEKTDSVIETSLDKLTTSQEELVGETNYDGQITIPYINNKPLRLLTVKQGGVILARLMLIQGFLQNYEVPVADDEVRIAASTVLLGIQDEITDQKIREEILNVRAEKQRERGDTDGLNRTLRELQRFRSREQFLAQVETERRRHQSPDALVQRRIDSMFNKTKQLIEKSMPKPP